MSKCTIPKCGEQATHVVRWNNNMGQRFCEKHGESVYLKSQDYGRLEKIDKEKGEQ